MPCHVRVCVRARVCGCDHLKAMEHDIVARPEYRKTYRPNCNWKVLIENFLEYYHLPAVHPALCHVSGVDEHDRVQGTGMYMAFGTFPLTKGGTALDPGRLPAFNGISEINKESAYHVCIFPNVFFSLYPDNFFRVILHPDGFVFFWGFCFFGGAPAQARVHQENASRHPCAAPLVVGTVRCSPFCQARCTPTVYMQQQFDSSSAILAVGTCSFCLCGSVATLACCTSGTLCVVQ